RLSYFRTYMVAGDDAGLGVMALLGMFAGLRFGEAAALRRSRVQLEEEPRIIVLEAATEVAGIVRIGPPKTEGSQRSVPIPVAVGDILRLHCDESLERRATRLNDFE